MELVEAVLRLRETYPRWGKDKLVVLLREEGYQVSTSMVGRIIRRLKDRGVLREPVRNHVSARRRGFKRLYAVRKPKDYQVTQPGDLIQLDTLDIRPLPGVVLKHFTAQTFPVIYLLHPGIPLNTLGKSLLIYPFTPGFRIRRRYFGIQTI